MARATKLQYLMQPVELQAMDATTFWWYVLIEQPSIPPYTLTLFCVIMFRKHFNFRFPTSDHVSGPTAYKMAATAFVNKPPTPNTINIG